MVKFQLINPGSLPTGAYNEAKLAADETHKLPLPPNCEGETDWKVIKERFQKFLIDESPTVLFVKQHPKCKDLQVARKVIAKIWSENGEKVTENLPRVCALDELFFQLARKFGADQKLECVADAREALDLKSLTLIAEGCKFHEEKDATNFCSLSRFECF